MSDPDIQESPPPISGFRAKVIFNYGLFFVFFIFYVGAAVIQTPEFKDLAMVQTAGMPLGLLLSLLVFPLSWVLMIIWFKKAK